MKVSSFPRVWLPVFLLLLLSTSNVDAAVYIYHYHSGNDSGIIAFEIKGSSGNRKSKKSIQAVKVFSRGDPVTETVKKGHFFHDLLPRKGKGEIKLRETYNCGTGKLSTQSKCWFFSLSDQYRRAVCKNTSSSGRVIERCLLSPSLPIYPVPMIISKMHCRSCYLVCDCRILPVTIKKSAAKKVSLLSQGQLLADVAYNKRGVATFVDFANGGKLVLSSFHPRLKNPQYREVWLKPEYFSPYFDPHSNKQLTLTEKPQLQEAKNGIASYLRNVTILYDVTEDFIELVRKGINQWVRSSSRALHYIKFSVEDSKVIAHINKSCKIKIFNNEPLIVQKKRELIEAKKRELGAEFDELNFEEIVWGLNWLNAWKPGYRKLQAQMSYTLTEKKRVLKSFNTIPLLEQKFIATYGENTYNEGNTFDLARDKNFIYYTRKKRNLFGADKDIGRIYYDINTLGLELLINDDADVKEKVACDKVKYTLDYSNATLTATYIFKRKIPGSLTVELNPVDRFWQEFDFLPPIVKMDKVFNGVWLIGEGESSWDYQPLFMEMLRKVDFDKSGNFYCFGDNKIFSHDGRLCVKKKCRVYQPVSKKIIKKAIRRFHHCEVLFDEDCECSFIDGRIKCRFWGGKIGH